MVNITEFEREINEAIDAVLHSADPDRPVLESIGKAFKECNDVLGRYVDAVDPENQAAELDDLRKAFNNVAWIMGGDNNLVMGNSDMTPVARALANAIKAVAPHHLMTFHSKGGVGSGATVHQEAWLDFNMAYEYQSSTWHSGPELYPQLQADFKRKPTKPFVLGEAHYDWPGTEWIGLPIRRQAYWTYLSGGAGHAYGRMSTMDFGKCCEICWREGLMRPARSDDVRRPLDLRG